MPYKITNYTKEKAKKLGVEVRRSMRKGKKIAVYKDNKKVADIGATGYFDYPTYLSMFKKDFADDKRRLYRIRHAGEQKKIGSPGYYAWHLLW